MAKKKVKPLLATLGYLHPAYAAAAVLEVFRYNATVAEPVQGFAADAAEWATHSAMRADLFSQAAAAWCRLAGRDFTWFPYSEDYVARLYARVAAAPADRRKAWAAELKEAMRRAPA